MENLIKSKLNIIDKINLIFAKRKLENCLNTKGYEVWERIKNEKIKYNSEILELAWEKAETTDYKKFPTYIQEEKSKTIDKRNIVFLAPEIQNSLIKNNNEMLNFVDENIRVNYLKQNPTICEKYCEYKYSQMEKILFYEFNI